jgi:hypothetical protein
MGDRSFICVLTLNVIAVLHTCIHTKTAVSLKKERLDLRDFGIRDGFYESIYRVKRGVPVLVSII